ncbi:hypothetical protein CEXT_2181 [Caerostris extrusa]|uniref:DH domain-containing protein n=1 Tax=Caerostris extrusa TaxID=172846 RepID=A0AAV4SNJ2_CAEEX|nr:hypothetical protein CEXT_2181 [Caerostris extrusa]
MNSSHIIPIYPAYAGRHQFQNCDTLLSTEDLFHSRKLESIASPYSELVTCKEPDSRKTFTITQDNVIDLFLRECDLYLSVLSNVKLMDETLPDSRRVPDNTSQSMFVKIYNEIVRYLRLLEETFIANEEFQSNFESLPVSDRSFLSSRSSSEMCELTPLVTRKESTEIEIYFSPDPAVNARCCCHDVSVFDSVPYNTLCKEKLLQPLNVADW